MSLLLKVVITANNNNNSREWLFALPIASCDLKLDLRVAVGLRLGLDLCVPYECHCGSRVDAYGVHNFVKELLENNQTHRS